MKLLNPTEDQLNAAFAEHVAGWMWRSERGGAWFFKSDKPDPFKWVRILGPRGGDISLDGGLCFTRSADAVLPWLEKENDKTDCEYRFGRWSVQVGVYRLPGAPRMAMHSNDTFPRAAVIALLRAKGVEVEFA